MANNLIKGSGSGTREWREDFVLTDTDQTTALFKVAQSNGAVTMAGGVTDLGGGLVVNEAGAAVDMRVEGDTDANLLMVDGSADKVGIGVAAPEAKLDIKVVDASAAPNASSNLIIEDTGTNVIQLLGDAATGVQAVYFGDEANEASGQVHYTHSTDRMYLAAAAVERLGLAAGECVFNESGADTDFRVEGDTNTNLLVCDAGLDAVGIGGVPNGGYALSVTGDSYSSGHLAMYEMSAPTGVGNQAKIFAQDNGSGKTQLMVIFGTGGAIQLAIEA